MAALSSLAAKSCIPCRGGVPPLTREEVSSHQRQTPEWSVNDEARRIERTFRFRNFAEAFAFVGQVAQLAEGEEVRRAGDFRFGRLPVTVLRDAASMARCGRWTAATAALVHQPAAR